MRSAASTQGVRDKNLVFSFTFTFLFFSSYHGHASYPNVLYHFISMMILLNFHFILYLFLSLFFVLFSVTVLAITTIAIGWSIADFIHPDPLHLSPPLSLQHLKRAKFCPIDFSINSLAFLFSTLLCYGRISYFFVICNDFMLA